MTVRIGQILGFAEFTALGDDAVARGLYRNDRRVFTPGMAWYQPWYWDPLNERDTDPKPWCHPEDGFLSVHYWSGWADRRPPICVVCPNGEQWEIDRKSSNGEGWTVTCPDLSAEFPLIACSPSIVVHGYHGYLGMGGAEPGCFTQDIEGRGPIGVVRGL